MIYYFTLPRTPYKNHTGIIDGIPDLIWKEGEAQIDLPDNSDDIIERYKSKCLIMTGNVEVQSENDKLLALGKFGMEEDDTPLVIPEPIFDNVIEQEIEDCKQTYEQCSLEEQISALYSRLRDRHLSDRVATQAVKILRDNVTDRKERLKLFGINYKNLKVIEQTIEELKNEVQTMKNEELE